MFGNTDLGTYTNQEYSDQFQPPQFTEGECLSEFYHDDVLCYDDTAMHDNTDDDDVKMPADSERSPQPNLAQEHREGLIAGLLSSPTDQVFLSDLFHSASKDLSYLEEASIMERLRITLASYVKAGAKNFKDIKAFTCTSSSRCSLPWYMRKGWRLNKGPEVIEAFDRICEELFREAHPFYVPAEATQAKEKPFTYNIKDFKKTEEELFECKLCIYKDVRKDNVCRHMFRAHGAAIIGKDGTKKSWSKLMPPAVCSRLIYTLVNKAGVFKYPYNDFDRFIVCSMGKRLATPVLRAMENQSSIGAGLLPSFELCPLERHETHAFSFLNYIVKSKEENNDYDNFADLYEEKVGRTTSWVRTGMGSVKGKPSTNFEDIFRHPDTTSKYCLFVRFRNNKAVLRFTKKFHVELIDMFLPKHMLKF